MARLICFKTQGYNSLSYCYVYSESNYFPVKIFHIVVNSVLKHNNDPKVSDRQVGANSVDPARLLLKSDQDLHCLLFHLFALNILLHGKTMLFKFKHNYSNFCRCVNCLDINGKFY